MIEINQQVIIANKQLIEFEEYKLRRNHEGELESEIRFSVKGENGQFIRLIVIHLRSTEHNEFWNNFNSGCSLYELLAQKEGLQFLASQEEEGKFLN